MSWRRTSKDLNSSPKKIPPTNFLQKILPKFSPKNSLPKNSSQKIPTKKFLQKNQLKKFPNNSQTISKKFQKFPQKILKSSKQFFKKILRFWKYPIPCIALGGRKLFRACLFDFHWICICLVVKKCLNLTFKVKYQHQKPSKSFWSFFLKWCLIDTCPWNSTTEVTLSTLYAVIFIDI